MAICSSHCMNFYSYILISISTLSYYRYCVYGATDDEVRPVLAEPLHHPLHVIPVGPFIHSVLLYSGSLQKLLCKRWCWISRVWHDYVGVRLIKKTTYGIVSIVIFSVPKTYNLRIPTPKGKNTRIYAISFYFMKNFSAMDCTTTSGHMWSIKPGLWIRIRLD